MLEGGGSHGSLLREMGSCWERVGVHMGPCWEEGGGSHRVGVGVGVHMGPLLERILNRHARPGNHCQRLKVFRGHLLDVLEQSTDNVLMPLKD